MYSVLRLHHCIGLCSQMRAPGMDDLGVLQPGRGDEARALALGVEQA